jgi:potassium efflux system protein
VRRATVITPDRIAILVPNQQFITGNVTNHVYLGRTIRLRVPLSVAADSDLQAVRQLLLDAARTQPKVQGDPEPEVTLLALSAASISLELHVWYDGQLYTRQHVLSEVYAEIEKRLREQGIKLA